MVSNTSKLNIVNISGKTKNAPTSSKGDRTIAEATAFALPNNSCSYKPLSISATGAVGIVRGFMYDKYGDFVLLRLTRNRVRLWRNRWQDAAILLKQAESEGMDDEGLRRKIILVLMDEQRQGNPGKFSLEEIVQIVALACELPATSELPVTHWTPTELARIAVKRGILTEISPRSVGRFLKSSDVKTTLKSLLVKCKYQKPRNI